MSGDGRFVKGKSGNPGGRKKGIGRLVDIARQHTEEAIQTLVTIMRNKKVNERTRVAAADAILDRGWGKAPMVIETGDGDLAQAWAQAMAAMDADDTSSEDSEAQRLN